jgi:hypothetical protein
MGEPIGLIDSVAATSAAVKPSLTISRAWE